MITEQLLDARRKTRFAEDRGGEKPIRSVLKSISWRIVGTLDTIAISWVVTGALRLAFSIGIIELVTKMLLYFLHERIWAGVRWGR